MRQPPAERLNRTCVRARNHAQKGLGAQRRIPPLPPRCWRFLGAFRTAPLLLPGPQGGFAPSEDAPLWT
eukprot:2589286-Alexandrium_andersonii.AAC.1